MFRVRFVRRQDARVQDAAVFIHSLHAEYIILDFSGDPFTGT